VAERSTSGGALIQGGAIFELLERQGSDVVFEAPPLALGARVGRARGALAPRASPAAHDSDGSDQFQFSAV